MSDYDNTNRGALFPTGDQELIRAGEVHFGQTPERLAVIKVETKSGKTVFEVYQKIGAVFLNSNKTKENSPDMSGAVSYENKEYKIAGWKQQSNKGLSYTSIAVTPPEDEQQQERQDPPPADFDDDIPF